jgi:transcriptional regulator with XRE-family HTH domain
MRRKILSAGKIQKQLGLRLRELRLAKNLRQEDLGKWNFSYRYYGMIERGVVNPSLSTIIKLCNIFDISMSELFSFLESDGISAPQREAVAVKVAGILRENKTKKIKKLGIFLDEIL